MIESHLSQGDFLFVHFPIPHQPYVFDENGGSALYGWDVVGYDYQLKYVDMVLGRLVNALKEAGWLDVSWVLVTSDHGLQHKEYEGDGLRHVPLLVKMPAQVEAVQVWEPLSMLDLFQIPGFPLQPLGE